MGTEKLGTLCAGQFERGNATYWEVRRNAVKGVRTWLVYRTSVAVTLIGEYPTPDAAYEEYFKHVDSRAYDHESSMGN